MRIVRAAAQVVVPWKNGGGTTCEIAKEPATASLDAFDWRVSRAHVASDGPFSRFDGVDRTLLVLQGAGMRLDVEGSERVTLVPHSAPFFFPGDVPVNAALVGGPIDDLNVMTRRDRFRHRVERRRLTRDAALRPDADARVVYVESGAAIIDAETVTAGDAVICDGREELVLRPAAESLVVIVDFLRVNEE